METKGNNEPSIAEMASMWLQIKSTIRNATGALHALEQDMLPFLEQKDYGQATTEAGDFRVKVRNSKNYKVDKEVLEEVARDVDPRLIPLKTKTEIDATQIRYLELNEPQIWRRISEAFTSTPAKPGFVVERVEE